MNFPLIFSRPGLRADRSYSQVIARKNKLHIQEDAAAFSG